jgi:hypothetical protein
MVLWGNGMVQVLQMLHASLRVFVQLLEWLLLGWCCCSCAAVAAAADLTQWHWKVCVDQVVKQRLATHICVRTKACLNAKGQEVVRDSI